ncbi:hypothetical protein B9G98_00036 [Wickerhamiella sorbophila]|uniref:Uncharacterized protein n=1 Tax=Wickerhamiella sorbophila TaxID=45607 RepID=A0A2T0FBP1_9ASCO|nr:hypothetical protein B9G98_00036 [Wickerhamiella sorbophila]PRT52416.1 hypothetical protein B9G98_00036 [Wickerhamiella sorbophila]
MSIPVRRTDLRTETTFLASIAPAQGSVWKTAYLVIRDQIAYPFFQGLLWAFAKDWFVVGKALAATKGHVAGEQIQNWLSVWWRANIHREL